MRRDGALLAEANALLARFVPGPGRTGRVVLHPRLTVVPLDRADFPGLATSFSTDVQVRVAGPREVAAARSVEERAAFYDASIRSLDDACARHLSASAAVGIAERTLAAAREQLDRVYEQRARADEAIAAARERLAVLQGASSTSTDLTRELEIARADADAAMAEYEAARAQFDPSELPDLVAAEGRFAAARATLAELESEHEHDAIDAATYQLRYWTAQRAVEVERNDVERMRRQYAIDHDARERAAAAERALAEATARVDVVERALNQLPAPDADAGSVAETQALAEQIESVQRSIQAAQITREGEVRDAQLVVDTARREAAVAERQRAVAVDRAEPGTDARDAEALLADLRSRRETLDGADPTCTESLLRICAQETFAPILVLVAPFENPPADLIDALVAVSAIKRIVYVTDDQATLHAAQALDPEIGAIRTPLDTGGAPRPDLTHTDRNLL